MTWDMAIRVIAPEAARRSSYPEGAGNRNARSPPCRSYPTDLPVALRSAGFSPKDRWTAVREDAAAGGARIEAGRGGRKGWSSLPSALRFAIGEWFVARRRVASSYPFCAASPRNRNASRRQRCDRIAALAARLSEIVVLNAQRPDGANHL